jgi:bifunctional non-homologous end joining protein LigD
VQCCQVALWLREILSSHGLQLFAKTSGSKGMQVYAPLNSEVDYQATKTAALGLAQRLEREHPEAVVSMMERARRGGKVFIDWSQNDQHKTTVNVYSLRARPRPTVSTPVTWDEVEACLAAGDAGRLVFEAPAVLDRVQEHGDLFEPLLSLTQTLPAALLEGVEAPAVDPAQRKASWARRREIEKARPPATG